MSTPARILMVEGDTVPPAPTSGQVLLYAKTNNTFYSLNSLGVETPLGGGGGGSGTVTSVAATGNNGISVTGSPITNSGTLTFGLGAITPTSVAATGTVTGSNLSGTNTGDQTSVTGNAGTATALQIGRTLAITGDLSWTSPAFNGSANVTAAGTLATVNSNVGTFGSSTQVPVFTVNAKGLVTAVSNVTITSGSGSVTSVAVSGSDGINVAGSPITTSGTFTLSLGAITPSSVASAGSVTGTNLSGTNTGDQTITLTGDVTGSGTGSFAATLSTTGVSANTYGSSTQVPVFTVDTKGRISNVTNATIVGTANAPDVVVFRYSSGSSGNFTAVDSIFSQTANVTATVIDGANCIVTFAFTGKSTPPKSVTVYGQNYSTNTFSLLGWPAVGSAQPNFRITGGGTSSLPDLANGIFSASNIITMQLRMGDTGASSTLGNRAYAIVVFGF